MKILFYILMIVVIISMSYSAIEGYKYISEYGIKNTVVPVIERLWEEEN